MSHRREVEGPSREVVAPGIRLRRRKLAPFEVYDIRFQNAEGKTQSVVHFGDLDGARRYRRELIARAAKGEPVEPLHGTTRSAIERRFMAKVDETKTCWLWTAALDRHGYGKFRLEGHDRLAHRVAYELFVGPIPEGMTLDHACRVTSCVNPQHLQPMAHRTNNLRGISPAAINARKTHCIRGHEFTPENTYVRPGTTRRRCRACHAESERQRKLDPAYRARLAAYQREWGRTKRAATRTSSPPRDG